MNALRYTGPLGALDPPSRRALLDRAARRDEGVRSRTAEILARVRADGDAALFALARELDHATLPALEVPRAAWRAALEALDPAVRRALDRAARNIATAHRAFAPRTSEVETEPGVVVGRRPDPFARAGLYAPGGRAVYPSSVLMTAIPARVAGVGEVVLCSPPDRAGRVSPLVLAAAEIAGVDRVLAIGGAGAIGALAYGTETVPRVDVVAGPGNAYVAEAKLQVAALVAIDSPAGPSELLAIADAGVDPAQLARELLAQAEHDPDACALAIVLDEALAPRVIEAIAAELSGRRRRETITAALAARGGVLHAASLDEALDFAGAFAPEHLLLALADPAPALARVRNAGAVFAGTESSVTFGDYLSGANHTLPTGGASRHFSGLSTADFTRWTSWQRVTPAAASRLAGDTAALANAEGLEAHAHAARGWERPGTAESADAPAVAPRALARPAYRDIPLYRPDLRPAAISLNDNTNRFGAAPAALRVLAEAGLADVSRYPDTYGEDLKRALAEHCGLAPEAVVTGCGSDDVIDSAIRAFAEPGEALAYSDPTFAMIPTFARMNGLTPIAVPLTADLDIDADALLATGARILYLCAPNNPTGACPSAAALERVVARAPGLVILDEAYADFAEADGAGDRPCYQAWLRRAPALDRLLVTRTLSKAFGLAGLRIGYAAGNPQLAREVEKSRGPFKVGTLAARAAVAALAEDGAWVRDRVAETLENRRRFVRELVARGLAPLPSEANFVLIPVRDAAAVATEARAAGVAVRAFPGLARVGDAVRVTIGPWPEMEAALEALEAVATLRQGAR